jgi:hypothetical protein
VLVCQVDIWPQWYYLGSFNKSHSFDPIENIIQVLHHQKKEAHLNTIERLHIHIEHAACHHLNDDHTIFPNKIFDTLIKLNAPLTP